MNSLKMIVLVGCPGCGKSTYAKTLADADPTLLIVCPDTFRAILGTGESDQSVSRQAFEMAYDAANDALLNGSSVIVDATNMHRKARKSFLDIAKRHNANKIAHVFELDKATLLERNKNRGLQGGRNVPEFVIDRMLSNYEKPEFPEFNTVNFITQT